MRPSTVPSTVAAVRCIAVFQALSEEQAVLTGQAPSYRHGVRSEASNPPTGFVETRAGMSAIAPPFGSTAPQNCATAVSFR